MIWKTCRFAFFQGLANLELSCYLYSFKELHFQHHSGMENLSTILKGASSMQCPACCKETEEIAVDDIAVDVCTKSCGGIWFDRFELQKVDEPHEAAGERLLQVKPENQIASDEKAKRMCPKCENMSLMRHFFSVKREVEVDECPKCGGFWLDYGELGQIRSQFSSEEERKKAAQAYCGKAVDGGLKKMEDAGGESQEKAKKIGRMFRFIMPK
ncbi:MAG: hypothetical protein D3923_09645 [Candidatus Electrothrix sp. AR3]|nr:hypothetical protein [Candidatus Electrothrix sp. AR3]